MTKTDWYEILEELKTMRSTNKFGSFSGIRYIPEPSTQAVKIEMVDTWSYYLLLPERKIISHKDVIDVTPREFRRRFEVTINPFKVNKISFK